ncbi:MAG: hypothetical protein PHQ58_19725 [Rhodoferax sp.]|uniref:hypothetical protein n=1 Tax=Rhodoferax sp. TaxID=50421 RepID=UPI002613A527|nr:hypothetical protein [Rhodoferax sp.]MDD2882656.1 hypothetical protein [Rhodoferax sp.]
MIRPSSSNPRISPLLSAVTWLEVAVLVVAGGGLLIAHPLVIGIWPWTLAPFNLRFLGALYTAALLAAFLQSWFGKWAPARTVTTMIFVFTLVVTACSFLHWDRFDPAKVEVWVWFVLYIGVCLNAGAHLWWYRSIAAAGSSPSSRSRVVLLAQTIVLGGYGLALLIAPEPSARLWPWKLDAFHAQLYSVTFLTPAVGALSLLRSVTRIDWFTLGFTQLAWGLLPILALVIVDLQLHRVDWLAWQVWLWIGLFVLTAAMGVWMLLKAAAQSVLSREGD